MVRRWRRKWWRMNAAAEIRWRRRRWRRWWKRVLKLSWRAGNDQKATMKRVERAERWDGSMAAVIAGQERKRRRAMEAQKATIRFLVERGGIDILGDVDVDWYGLWWFGLVWFG